MSTKNVLFIHGLFVTHHCWDAWVSCYEAKGYTCRTISYPGRDKTAAELRAKPDPNLANVTLDEIVEVCRRAAQSFDTPPIIIGHSMGGLFTQIMNNQGYGAAGIAIDSAPPRGILPISYSFLRANFPVLNPLVSDSRPHTMSFPAFQYAFVNGMPLEEQRAAYDTHVVSESLKIPRGALSSKNALLDFKKSRAPLLLIAGEIDHIIPASLNKTNYARYKDSPSVTDFKEFAGRNHWIIAQKGWEEVADYALNWAEKQKI